MSVRDEMVKRIDEAWSFGPDVIANALMPIVERVAREVASVAYIQGFRAGTNNDFPFAELAPGIYDEIVRRVVGDE